MGNVVQNFCSRIRENSDDSTFLQKSYDFCYVRLAPCFTALKSLTALRVRRSSVECGCVSDAARGECAVSRNRFKNSVGAGDVVRTPWYGRDIALVRNRLETTTRFPSLSSLPSAGKAGEGGGWSSRFAARPPSLTLPAEGREQEANSGSCFEPVSLCRVRNVQLLALLTGLLLFSATPASAADRPAELPVDVRPYRVRLAIAFDAPQLSEAAQREMLLATEHAARRCVGQMWQLQVEPLRWLQPVSAAGLSRLKVAELIERADSQERAGGGLKTPGPTGSVGEGVGIPGVESSSLTLRVGVEAAASEPVEVWFVATVQAARPGYRVEVRAWQPEIQLALASVGDRVVDARDAPFAILKLCWQTFRPVGVVEGVDGHTVQVRLRAGALSAPDARFALAQPNDIFVPSIAVRSRENRVERLLPIPWTYLTATEVSGTLMTANVGSGLRSPISAKQRGRNETIVVAVRPQQQATRLELATQTKPSLPLVAHRIELRSSPVTPVQDDPVARLETLVGELLTDRRGLVTIAVDRERPLVWLFAYSGQHLLARVPFVPGVTSHVRLEVPDDSARLAAEADVQMLQGQLIDAVAVRNTQIGLIRAAAKQRDWKEQESRLAGLAKLEDAQSFLDRLAAVRVPAVNAAKTRKDKVAEARINRLCDEMATLIRQYLSEDRIKQLNEEATELRKADAEAEEKEKG